MELPRGEGESSELHCSGGRLWLIGDGERRDLGLVSGVESIRSPRRVRLTGDLRSRGVLSLEAPEVVIAGSVCAKSLAIEAAGMISLEPSGSLTIAPEGRLSLEADYLSIAGPISAPGGELSVEARAFLHQGAIVLDASEGGEAGRAAIDCDRYVGSIKGVLAARNSKGSGGSLRLMARTSLFSSGRFDVRGKSGGEVWLSGRDTRLVGATLDASGAERAGSLWVGTETKGARADGASAWHADSLLSTRPTLLRAESARGDAGEVVVGSATSTRFEGEIQVCSALARGGRVEVSSSGDLYYGGDLHARGPMGPGALLLDPQNLDLSDGAGVLAQFPLVDPNPNGTSYGGTTLPLSGGNVLVGDSEDDLAAASAGAVYLFNGTSGVLISTLTGSTANDQVGSVGPLTNGNFVVVSQRWDNGGTIDAGAATWGDGSTGVSGPVSMGNSLHGTTASDRVGEGITALTNGSYVVKSSRWNNGAASDAGAATWGDGATGVSGPVTTANSLHGTSASDRVCRGGVQALTNGNYVVMSYNWNNGATSDAGAATWGNGATGIAGAVSSANSLHGSTAFDQVSLWGVTALTNGNYVVGTSEWNNGGVTNVGAATWADGTTGIAGPVTTANSLHGVTAGDQIGSAGGFDNTITALSNGNYVVGSASWDDAGTADVGAATWADGSTGLAGPVTAANSLHGTTATDFVAASVVALRNGNYVVRSSEWNNAGVADVGAATWANGVTGLTGPVTTANSLYGTSLNDRVASGISALTNGNYVVRSKSWDLGGTADVGAVTWGDGTVGVTGPVSSANSLHGTTANDQISSDLVTVLINGNYVVRSPNWDLAGTVDVGAATWGNGSTGTSGPLTTSNSLHGSTANDRVCSSIALNLSDGNYLVCSPNWDNGPTADVGAATWCDGAAGTSGPVTTANSLHGSTASDQVAGIFGGFSLANGNYVVTSQAWDNGAVVDAGALTLGHPGGVVGPVGVTNSVLGTAPSGSASARRLGSGFAGSLRGHLAVVVFPLEATTFAQASGRTITSPTARITQLLSEGTNVTLQASQDITITSPITVNNPTGQGGDLTLIAGRSVIINAAVTTDDGSFEARANSDASAGVVDADRGVGAGAVKNNATIDAGTGSIRFETQAGVGLTNNARAEYTLGSLSAGSTAVVPFADSLTPAAAAAGMTSVTLQGGGLAGASITVGGVAATGVQVSGSSLTFTPGANTPNGAQAVVVTASGVATNAGTLTVSGGSGGGGGGGVPLAGSFTGRVVTKTKGKDCSLTSESESEYPWAILGLAGWLVVLRRRR